MSADALKVYIAGIEALLAHEAALQRGPDPIRCLPLRCATSRFDS